MTSPKCKPVYKISPDVVNDTEFKERLKKSMEGWQEVRERKLDIMPWWELMVKPGIRRLGINRSKELKKERRGELNLLMLRQAYLTTKLQAGELGKLGELREVKALILCWYQEESQKVVLQSRVDDVQESEKVRIYHHEQHKRHVKRSSILQLHPEGGELLEGHDACSTYLEEQVRELLDKKAVLCKQAQAELLAEVDKVFTDTDNDMLTRTPTKDEIAKALKASNMNSAPGTDGLTFLLYSVHWDILEDAMLAMITAMWEGSALTASQRTSLMVFGKKPGKGNSLLPGDLRRISLLNSDFKLMTSLEARRFKSSMTHTVSPLQLVAGDDRRIHHGIARARDAIQAVSKFGVGCALLDLDFLAAFDYQVFNDWVLPVLRAKGLAAGVEKRLVNIFENRITIPVVNSVQGKAVKNTRRNLSQGCPSAMNWFSYAIDPLLCYLERRLQGIPIYSLPVHGPAELGARRPDPLVMERYKVLGLADDLKPSVTNMAEFATVERGATLFELATGNKLHRDPIKGKCKVLLLGRWRGRVQQEDIGLPHLRIVDTLAFIGVKLTASWQKTRKENMDELQARVKTTINSWKSGKVQPLVCRPFSVNTFCLSKIWFRTHTVDMREGDITNITSTVKQYIYQDMFEKPSELLLFRPVEPTQHPL